jgi:hypothetical protein
MSLYVVNEQLRTGKGQIKPLPKKKGIMNVNAILTRQSSTALGGSQTTIPGNKLGNRFRECGPQSSWKSLLQIVASVHSVSFP